MVRNEQSLPTATVITLSERTIVENLIRENENYKLYKSIFNDNHFIVRKSDNETMETFTDNNKAVDCFRKNYEECCPMCNSWHVQKMLNNEKLKECLECGHIINKMVTIFTGC